ncbi:hypothetical protein EON83_03050 [bacterium]|nr:MAG: hypothetical protein EON83_03050 [bacterium]
MKGFDPHLIKWIIFGIVFLVRAGVAINRKRKKSNATLRPPQSAPAPSPIGSPTMNQSKPMPRTPAQEKASETGSPWSTTNGPFD